MLTSKKTAFLALVVLVAACRRDNVRGLDAHPEVPATLEFGVLAVDQIKAIPITISNSGQIELAVQELRIDEPFDVEVPPDAVVPGCSSDVLVKFQPVQPGEVTKILTLSTSSVESPLIQVQLHGIAYQPRLETDPDRLDFGDVAVGSQKTLTFQVTNTSPVALNVDAEPAEDTSDFAISPQGLLGRLEPKQATTVTVSFAPTAAGPASSAVALDCPVCASKQVQLTGNGVALPGPQPTCTLGASPARVDFGKLSFGQTARQVVTVTSSGTILLRPEAVSRPGQRRGAFRQSARGRRAEAGPGRHLHRDVHAGEGHAHAGLGKRGLCLQRQGPLAAGGGADRGVRAASAAVSASGAGQSRGRAAVAVVCRAGARRAGRAVALGAQRRRLQSDLDGHFV